MIHYRVEFENTGACPESRKCLPQSLSGRLGGRLESPHDACCSEWSNVPAKAPALARGLDT